LLDVWYACGRVCRVCRTFGFCVCVFGFLLLGVLVYLTYFVVFEFGVFALIGCDTYVPECYWLAYCLVVFVGFWNFVCFVVFEGIFGEFASVFGCIWCFGVFFGVFCRYFGFFWCCRSFLGCFYCF